MNLQRALAFTVMIASLAIAVPAQAQTTTLSNVSFFDRAHIGGLEFSAVNIFYDDRCVDQRLCFRSNQMAISIILFGRNGLSERVMRLGEKVRVPGGMLELKSTGTPPSRQGAIPLDRYSLTFEFTPTKRRGR